MSDLQCAATLLVACHGAAEYETDLLSDAGGSLTADGRDQARELATSLAGRRIAHVYSSPLSRAVQTAEIAAGLLGVGVRVREGLEELTVGTFAGQPEEPNPFTEVFAAWNAGDLAASYPGGQSASAVLDRVRAALEGIADLHRGETVLVISHGAVMSLALPRLVSNLRDDHAYRGELPDGAVVEIAVDSDDWVCVGWP